MIVQVVDSRLVMALTKTQAARLIEDLTRSLSMAEEYGTAGWAEDVTVEGQRGQSVPGRITIRVEG